MPPQTGTPTTVEAVCAALRAEAEQYLAAAERAKARGQNDNATWCIRSAFGCARAIAVVRRLG